MDLRVQKTRRAIIDAFLELRKEKSLNKITIAELSKKAVISKATFYLHYRDIYDLSGQLQDELISDIIREIPHPELMITEPQKYTADMLMAFSSKQELIDILFPKRESNNLPNRIEYYIKDAVYTHFPRLKGDLKTDITLTYLIQGGFYAYSNYAGDNFDEARDCIISISKLIAEQKLVENI